MTSYTGSLPPLDTKRQMRQLVRLVEISLNLNSTLDTDRLLQYIINVAAEILECDAASIMLYDEERNELHFAASSGTDPEILAQIPVPLDSSIAGAIFKQNQALIINDLASDPRHFDSVGEKVDFRPTSLVGVPMRMRDKVTGVLEGLNKREGDFSQEDVHLLSVIASQAAVAIQNARLLESLKDAYAELSEIDQRKSDFIALASHELRTPLGIILGYAQFLTEDAEGEMADHANRVLNSAFKMRTIIEDMSLLKMAEMELHLQPQALQPILQQAYRDVQAAAQEKGHTVVLDLPLQPEMVQADERNLRRVFVKLLDNAVRFTPDGGLIDIWLEPGAEHTLVCIRDNGVGIPAGRLEKIFDDFYQVEDHMTRQHGGIGVGLTIARNIMELHGGRVWAESPGEGQGATFKVSVLKGE